jgi:hypothetical protein
MQRLIGGRRAPVPLRGRPATRRIKHYAALSGYAYEYAYAGYRERGGGREYIFLWSASRRNWREIAIQLSTAPLAAWQQRAGRVLADNERYALAKLTLLSAFDEMESPTAVAGRLVPDADLVGMLLERLNL